MKYSEEEKKSVNDESSNVGKCCECECHLLDLQSYLNYVRFGMHGRLVGNYDQRCLLTASSAQTQYLVWP